jgi:CheY-like chemotaxis protein
MSQGRILVVEDIPDVRTTICGIIKDAGYYAYPVSTREEALKILETEHFHVAVLDIRLDDSDEDNQDGILLMREIADKHPLVTNIILTGYANVDLIQTALQPDRQGISPAFSFLKKEDIIELPDYIQRAFRLRIKLNESLVIEDSQTQITQLASTIRFTSSPTPNKTIIEEIQEIFKKLFFECQKIQIYPIEQGFSGAIIFRVVPWYQEKGRGEDLIVKIGEGKSIKAEEENYKGLVEGIIGGHRIPKAIKVAYTKSFAGILYTFIGLDHIHNFASFYKDASPQELETAIDNLYLKTCFPWQHERGQYMPGFNLKSFYISHLRLYPKKLTSLLQHYTDRKLLFIDRNLEARSLAFGNYKLVNPISFINEADFHSNCFLSTVHGDLTGHNVLVDHHLDTWLIDFATTKNQGHILQDYASFENYIRLLMIKTDNLDLLYLWEKSLFQRNLTDISLPADTFVSNEIEKATHVIKKIRQLAQETRHFTNRAYLIGLFFNAIRTTTFLELPDATRDHAFLSAAIIAERILGGAGV